MVSPSDTLRRIRSVADYQFGRGIGQKLFPERVRIQFSPATGRIRYVNLDGQRLVTYRPTDGLFSLSIFAAQHLTANSRQLQFIVTVRNDIAKFVAEGGDVFAAHIVRVEESVHAKDEVVVVDEAGKVLGVGRALLSSGEMLAFKTGVAVKTRHGCEESSEKAKSVRRGV